MFCLTLKGFYTFKILVRIMIFDKQTSFLSSFRSELAEVILAHIQDYTEALVTGMRFQVVPFSGCYLFKSIYFGLHIQMFAFS